MDIQTNTYSSEAGLLLETYQPGRVMRYLIFTLLVLPIIGSAHHSRAEFSSEREEIEGKVVEIAWRNPHPILTLSVTNEAGEEELWEVESWSSANSLSRKGVVGDVFEIGQTVRAAVRQSGRRPGMVLGESISLGNGTQAVLRPGYEPVFPGEAVLGNEAKLTESENSNGMNGQNLGLFRIWSLVDREGPGDLPLTAAAFANQQSYDELADHPMWNCDPIGMPVIMDSTLPVEFIDQGQEIHLRIEQGDALRVIQMQPTNNAANMPSSIMGYSIGQWEGNTLVVTTTNSSYPYLDDDGAAKSEDMQIDERFSLGADGNTLRWEATLTDPVYLSSPISMSMDWKWVPEETIQVWNCLESSLGRQP